MLKSEKNENKENFKQGGASSKNPKSFVINFSKIGKKAEKEFQRPPVNQSGPKKKDG